MRVAITTTQDRFDHVADAFSAAGFVPVLTQCITIIAHEQTALMLGNSVSPDSQIVLSSVRALDLCWPDELPTPSQWLVVGEATATAIRLRGGTNIITGTAGLAHLLRTNDLSGQDVVFPHAAGTDPSVFGLISDTSSLKRGPVYTTTPIAPPNNAVDAVMFGSPSAVTGWHLRRTCAGLKVGAIGNTTAAALEEKNVSVDVLAPLPTFRSLANALRTAIPQGNP